jgi:hypothetical protein
MNRNDLVVGQPNRLFPHPRLQSLSQCHQGIAIFVHDLLGRFHCRRKVGVVRKELQPAAGEFDDMEGLPSFDIKALHEFAGQNEPIGIANALDFELHEHILCDVLHFV